MSDDALTGRQAREHIEDIASALRTINGRAEELVEAIEERDEAIEERDEIIARLIDELAEARAALRDTSQIVEDLRDASCVAAVDLARDMTPDGCEAMHRWLAGDHSRAVEAAR